MYTKKEKFMEYCMLITGPLGSVFTIPQIIKIYFTHTHLVQSLSILTWTVYLIICLLWVVYGIIFRRKAVLITNMLYVITYTVIVIGIIYYG